MRTSREQILASYSNFISLPGSAEATGLANASIDIITAGMALQWFDIPLARVEFQRILAPGGWVALVWNRMLTGPRPFMRAYTDLILEYSPGWTETLRRDGPGSSLDLPGFFLRQLSSHNFSDAAVPGLGRSVRAYPFHCSCSSAR